MAQLNFDATQVEPDTGIDVVPAGWYNVMMDESDTKPTKDGAGTYLQCRFNIMDGQFRGRKVWCRLNIRNSNAQAQEIALRQLSAIGHAVGVLHIQDSQQLHGIPLKVKVKIRKGDDNYEDQNEIIAYRNINEVVDTGAAAPAAGGVPAGFGAPPAQAPAGFAPQTAPAQPPVQTAPPAQPWAQPAAAPAQAAPAQEAPAQPWAQPPVAAAMAQDPSNPFNAQPPAQPPAQAAPTAEPAAPWNGGAAPAPGTAAPAAAAQAPADSPALAAAVEQAQSAAPPWAQQG